MARVTGPKRTELDARGDAFAARVVSAIRSTLRVVAADARTVDDLARIETVWRTTVSSSLMPRLRATWNTAVLGVRMQLEEINNSDRETLVAAVFEIPKVSNPLAESFLAGAENRLVAIGDVVWYTARGEMLTGMQLGEGVAELKERVIASANLSSKRAEVVARTEVNSAMNNGAYQQMKALDVPTIKEWIATDDSRTRESHADVDGEEIAGDAKFMVGGFPMDHPHDLDAPPSETINCRCTLAWEIADDEDDYEEYLVAAGDFDESEHPRDGKGRFAKKAGSSALSVGGKLKITHGLIHKKHAPGKVIAINGDAKKRVVWDGNKYLLQEKDANGGWPTVDTAIKSKAYARVNEFDSDWHEPEGDDSDPNATAPTAPNTKINGPKPGQSIKKPGAGKKGGASPGAALKITHGLVHQKHDAGTVIAENGDKSKRVRWDGKQYELQSSDGSGGWKTDKTAIKSKAYVEINAYDSDWRAPDSTSSDSTSADSADTTSKPTPKTTSAPSAAPKKSTGGTTTPPASDDSDDPFLDDDDENDDELLADTKNSWLWEDDDEGEDEDEPSGPQPLTGYKKVGGQAGSNAGGLYQAPDGEKWYVKAPKSDTHARNEVLGNQLYELAGVKVPHVELAQLGANSPFPGKADLGVKSKIIDGERDLTTQVKTGAYKKKLHEDFAVDAWLGNWDVVGQAYDNVITDKQGDPVRIDVGGALLFRAQGLPKGKAFGDKVDEIDTLRDYSKNPQAANVFGDISDEDIRKGVAKVEAVTPEQIDAVVDNAGFTGKTANDLKSKLKARREDLIKRFGSGAPAPAAMPAAPPTPARADTSATPAPTPAPASSSSSSSSSTPSYAMPKSMFDLTKIKAHKNGVLFTGPSKIEYLVTPASSEKHARNQFLAANLYNFAGVAVENTDMVELDPDKMNGATGIGVKTKPITPSGHSKVTSPNSLSSKAKKQLAEGFAIDAWLGNWSVAGTGGENLVVSEYGDVYRTNLGGSVLFRASGAPKGSALSDTVDEIDSLRNPSLNATSASIFANVTDDDIRKGVAHLEKLQPTVIDYIVDQSGFTGAEGDALKKKLKARRQDLIDRFGSNAPKPSDSAATPATATPAPSSMPTATNALGGAKTFTPSQKAKVQSIFAKHNLKWHNKTHLIYDAALEVSKTHPDLTMGDALDIMDGTLKKSDKPFRTKVEKWLKTNAGKSHVISVGGSASVGSTSSKTPGTGVAPATAYVPWSKEKPAVEFGTPMPKVLTVADADQLQIRLDQAWPPPWTPQQRKALRVYTGGDYVAINRCLRTGVGCNPTIQNTIANIKAAVKPSTDDITVYRSTNPNAFGIHDPTTTPEFAAKIEAMVGKTFTDEGVSSTSIRTGVFSGAIKLEIQVPKGAKIAWVKRLSQHTTEDEIILAPGTKFEVLSIEPHPSYPWQRIMKVRVVIDEDA